MRVIAINEINRKLKMKRFKCQTHHIQTVGIH